MSVSKVSERKWRALSPQEAEAVSDLTLQIRADVFDMKVMSLENEESGTLACMIMAAAGVGAYPSIQDGIKRAVKIKKVFTPDSEMHTYYMEKFRKYKLLYEKMYDFK